MAVLSLIVDPEHYRPCEWDLLEDADARRYWLDLFRTHIESIARLMREQAGRDGERRVAAFLADYRQGLAVLDDDPRAWGALNVLRLTEYRQRVMQRHGFRDPFERIKAAETRRAIALYPRVVAALDALPPPERIEALARGVFAGNEFDLGCEATTARYHDDGHDFDEAVARVPPRPWPFDDLDRWAEAALPPNGYRRVLFFVDNAGADAILGCVPLARELARLGACVTLAANSEPALNDITIGELNDALGALRRADAVLAGLLSAGRLATVASGCAAPLIDLCDLSDACADASRGADLLILEGMGRSVETNRSAAFACDVLRAALIKDPFVAERLEVPLFSPVWRFDRAGERA